MKILTEIISNISESRPEESRTSETRTIASWNTRSYFDKCHDVSLNDSVPSRIFMSIPSISRYSFRKSITIQDSVIRERTTIYLYRLRDLRRVLQIQYDSEYPRIELH